MQGMEPLKVCTRAAVFVVHKASMYLAATACATRQHSDLGYRSFATHGVLFLRTLRWIEAISAETADLSGIIPKVFPAAPPALCAPPRASVVRIQTGDVAGHHV